MKNDKWIYEIVSNFEAANRIEDYFVNTLGINSVTDEGDKDARVIYVYKKSRQTNPWINGEKPRLKKIDFVSYLKIKLKQK